MSVLHHLAVSGLSGADGPLFPRYKNGKFMVAHEKQTIQSAKGIFRRVWHAEDGEVVNMQPTDFDCILKEIFVAIDMPHLTSHSIRKSATKWAARCGAEQHQLLIAGRYVYLCMCVLTF
jgi:hypothetical protein